jgi:Arc/MetJ-type ribon-helix-helix transcriptional regulator
MIRNMTVKSTVSFTDLHHEFAHRKAREGHNGSVSSVVAAGIEALLQDEAEREVALQEMRKAIRQRLDTSREDWIEGTDDLFAAARNHLAAK